MRAALGLRTKVVRKNGGHERGDKGRTGGREERWQVEGA